MKYLYTILFFLYGFGAIAEPVLLYVEDFGSSNGNLVNLSLNSDYNENRWIINNVYNIIGDYPEIPNQYVTDTGSIAGAPYSNYLHTYDINEGIFVNAMYNNKVESDAFTVLPGFSCVNGYKNLKCSFYYYGGEVEDSAYVELYYKTDVLSWKATGQKFISEDKWKLAEIELPEIEKVDELKLGFRFISSGSGKGGGRGIGIDDVKLWGELSVANVTIDEIIVSDTYGVNMDIDFNVVLSNHICDGWYKIYLKDTIDLTQTVIGYFRHITGSHKYAPLSLGTVNNPLVYSNTFKIYVELSYKPIHSDITLKTSAYSKSFNIDKNLELGQPKMDSSFPDCFGIGCSWVEPQPPDIIDYIWEVEGANIINDEGWKICYKPTESVKEIILKMEAKHETYGSFYDIKKIPVNQPNFFKIIEDPVVCLGDSIELYVETDQKWNKWLLGEHILAENKYSVWVQPETSTVYHFRIIVGGKFCNFPILVIVKDCDTTTNIFSPTQKTLKNKIYFNPNPTKNQTTLYYKIQDNKNETILLKVYDLMGRNVYQQNLSPHKEHIAINTSDFENGMYLYVLEHTKEAVVLGSGKLLKQ